ncbi:MAG: hypothetical protein N3A66_05445 [Planctomycetota bacterium]|nr:hypothetical protein [Planctomycetota bacterium]
MAKRANRLAPEAALDVPPELLAVFNAARATAPRLGDVAEVFAGVMPRREAFRRLAKPGPGWAAAISAESVSKFYVAEPQIFVRLDRMALMRLPKAEEYDQPEKVVLRRVGPPVIAAVDRSRCLVYGDVYAIVPVSGLLCGYLAAALNSRAVDFYLNRIRPLAAAPAGAYLRQVDIEAIPLPVPSLAQQREIDNLVANLAVLNEPAFQQRSHEGRIRLEMQIEQAIFRVYGLAEQHIARLRKMGF